MGFQGVAHDVNTKNTGFYDCVRGESKVQVCPMERGCKDTKRTETKIRVQGGGDREISRAGVSSGGLVGEVSKREKARGASGKRSKGS